MNDTRHNVEQILNNHREADAMPPTGQTVARVFQILCVSNATYSRWRNQYRGMQSPK